MKKITCNFTAIFLVFILLFALAGCGKTKETVSDPIASTSVIVSDVVEQEQENDESVDKIESKPESTVSEPKHVSVEKITLNKYSVTLIKGSSDMPLVTMYPSDASDKGEIWTSDNEDVATVDGIGNITGVGIGECKVTVRSTDNKEVFAEVSVKVKKAPKEPEITYINGILIANKTYALPSTYNPGVDATANAALQKMFAAAKKDGLNMYVASGFRSYETQKQLYNNYVARDGVAEADRYSARPGHSEHQTGLAFDINRPDTSFTGSAEAKWLAKNCHKYGFIIRYPQGKEHITGYMYESWHIRYLGVETAKAVYKSGLCLEEYLDITSEYKD